MKNSEEYMPNEETIAAIEEGRRNAYDPNVKKYSSMEELWKALLEDDDE